MSLWGKPVTRHYVHEYPVLSGEVIKRLLSLQPGRGWFGRSRAGRRIEITRLSTGSALPEFRLVLTEGRSLILKLESTRTAFNGVRWWYCCPHCSRRCAHLHWLKYTAGCRQCLALHYQSQSETPHDRALRRIRSERYAIWGEDVPGINNIFRSPDSFPKPKGMHWQTFDQKIALLQIREQRYLNVMMKMLRQRYGKYF